MEELHLGGELAPETEESQPDVQERTGGAAAPPSRSSARRPRCSAPPKRAGSEEDGGGGKGSREEDGERALVLPIGTRAQGYALGEAQRELAHGRHALDARRP